MQIQVHKSLSSEQQKKFLTVCKNEIEGKYRTYILFFLCLYYTGGRSKEVLNLTRKDITFGKKPSVWIRGVKGSNNRTVPIPLDLGKELDKFSSGLGEKDNIFSFSYGHGRDRFKYIFRFGLGLHCFRHTFGINMYKRTKDFLLVQSLLGHKNIQNTTCYVKYCNAEEAFKLAPQTMELMCP